MSRAGRADERGERLGSIGLEVAQPVEAIGFGRVVVNAVATELV